MASPSDPESTVDLAHVRAEIDDLDRAIIDLIARRQRWVEAAGRLKTDRAAVRAPARVEQVVAQARARALESGASPDVVERTYRALIAAFIDHELTLHADD